MNLKVFKTTIVAQNIYDSSTVEHTFTVESSTKEGAELDAIWLFWDKVDCVYFNLICQETEEVT